MGNCLFCFRTNQNSNEHHQYQIKPSITGLHVIQNQLPDVESVSEAGSVRCVDRQAGGPFDCQSNGSNKNCNTGMPDKRSFYSRIPPLPKSISSESRRAISRDCSDAKIVALFEHYKDPTCDAMLAEGIVRFCVDLDVKPEDLRVLLFAWKCNAETMCKFTKEEFTAGCRVVRGDSIKTLQQKLPELLTEVLNVDKFKDLYRFTFRFGLDTECGQRLLPTDVAVVLWKLVFSLKEPPILHKWISFLESHVSIRGIPKDTWYMFLNFTETVSTDFSSYDDNAAWPSLFDDFVEYENDQLNQNISKDQKHET